MEKRNIIENGRTPNLIKRASEDDFEKQAVAAFKPIKQGAPKIIKKGKRNG